MPTTLQRTILEFLNHKLTDTKAALATELVEQQQKAADLATENKCQPGNIEDKTEAVTALPFNLANLQGRMAQMDVDMDSSSLEDERERKAAEAVRTELAKSLLRLQAMPRLKADLASLRLNLDKKLQGHIVAEQQAAVLDAKLEAMIEHRTKAGNAALDALAQTRSNGETVLL